MKTKSLDVMGDSQTLQTKKKPECQKNARRNKETNIYAKERALDNVIDQRISRAIISRRNLTHIIPDEIYKLDPTRQATVKTVIYQCGVCRKYNGGLYKMSKIADWLKEKNP